MGLWLLSVLWICWCVMHSILIDTSFLGMVKKRAPWTTRYYRLFYNGVSLVTLAPLAVFTRLAEGPVVIRWEGSGTIIRILLIVAAFFFFAGGARQYDLYYFLGIRQLQTGEEHLLLSDTEEFVETGVLGVTRHPWYLGSLLLLWSIWPSYPLPIFAAVSILTVYLVAGSILEERKILSRYGDSYRQYQKRVSMLFPWKWLKQLLR